MPPEEIKPDDYAGTPGSGSVPGSSSPMDDLAKLVAEENARDAAEAAKGVPAPSSMDQNNSSEMLAITSAIDAAILKKEHLAEEALKEIGEKIDSALDDSAAKTQKMELLRLIGRASVEIEKLADGQKKEDLRKGIDSFRDRMGRAPRVSEPFNKASSFDDLFDDLRMRKVVTDGNGVKNPAGNLIDVINAFRAGKAQINEITKAAGLRGLVRELDAAEKSAKAVAAPKGVPATGEAIAEKITANSFDELFDELNRRGSLVDGSGVKNSATLLIYTINAFRAGKAQINEITQTAGLRELVSRLRVTEELDAYFVATGASAPTGAPKAPDSPEDEKKALEALILATKTRSLDLLFSDQLPGTYSFSQIKFIDELVKDIADKSVKAETVKQLGVLIELLIKKGVLRRLGSSKLVAGKALDKFDFKDEARVAEAKESLLKGEEIKKPVAAAPAAPGTTASPTGAPAAPDAVVPANDVVEKDYVKDFLPDQTTLDKEAPLERAEPFDPKKALKNPGFVEWFKENEATIGLTEADFAGTDAKKLERAALFYDAYEARSEVLVGVKKFIATELENLGVKSGDGVIAADDFNGKIEEYLAKNLLEKPERILRIKEILDDNAGLVEDAKKLQEEAKKKLEKLNERALGGREISALDQEEQLLKELKKIETGELADVGSAVAGRVEKLFQRAASFLHLGGGGTAKYSGSRDSVGALMRSSRENDAVLAYEKFNKDRGVFTPITKEGVDSRLSEVQKLKSQATSLPEDIKAAKEELKTAKASLSLARDSAIGALGIAKLALESSEGAVSKHIGGLFKAVDDSADKKKYEQIRVADKNISKLKGSLGDGFDGAIDSAETELKAKIAKLAEEEIVRNTDSLRSLDDESLISSMAEQLKPLFLASSGFNVITRDEYKEIMIFALDKAANHFSKKKESAKAAALRQFSLSVKNAEPGDDAFVKILEKKPVKPRKKS